MRRRRVVSDQPLHRPTRFGPDKYTAVLRLRGQWLADILPIGTKIRVTRELLLDQLALLLESLETE